MTPLLLNVILALVWAGLTGAYGPANLIAGFFIAFGVLFLLRAALPSSEYFTKAITFVGFVAFFLWELVRANLRVAFDVLTPRHRMRPAVIAVPLDVTTDLEITLLANLITLTPGTLTVDVSADRRVLYVHSMYVDDPEAFRREIKEGFERWVRELLA